MRIAHITNFYGPTASAQIDQLHRSASTYKSAGHEFIAFVPSYQLATIETDQGKIINLPSIRIPFTRGRRIITSKKTLKTILVALDVDQIEIINQPLLNGFAKWAAGRNIKVLKSHSPVEVIDSSTLARRDLISIPA
jgi:alpha-1,6-mannosyltransferase